MAADQAPATTAACGAHKVFERDTFARTPRAEVWCHLPAAHKGAHEATLARVSYCWSDLPTSAGPQETAPCEAVTDAN